MFEPLKQLDGLLRGDVTRPAALREGKLQIPAGTLSLVILVLALLYGACMGTYSLFKESEQIAVPAHERYWQALASTIKVPLLFFLTLVVTFPSLYVFNALVGSRLRILPVLQLLIASLGVTLAVLASLGPIVAFFSVSTQSYPFMVLFNVLMFTISGALGMLFLVQTLNRLSPGPADGEVADINRPIEDSQSAGANDPSAHERRDSSDTSSTPGLSEPSGYPSSPNRDEDLGALEMAAGHVLGRHVKLVFRVWLVVFGLVGAQMGWVLRPFIGNPGQAFQWFRERESNFFEAVFQTAIRLLTGSG